MKVILEQRCDFRKLDFSQKRGIYEDNMKATFPVKLRAKFKNNLFEVYKEIRRLINEPFRNKNVFGLFHLHGV